MGRTKSSNIIYDIFDDNMITNILYKIKIFYYHTN
jgi:hypothetical protein